MIKLKVLVFLLCLISFIFSSKLITYGKPFVIHVSRETTALGVKNRDQVSDRPVWWPDPENIRFETTFEVPFSGSEAEFRIEALNVNSTRNFIRINGYILGSLYPDTGMSFVPSSVIIPFVYLRTGKNTLSIESDPGLKEEYDEFLIRNIEIVIYKPGDEKLPPPDTVSATAENPYNPEQMVTISSFTDVYEGEEFTLRLISSSMEGYKWQLVDKSYDHKILRLVSQNERVYDNYGRMEQLFTFLPITAGVTSLEFRKFFTSTGELALMDAQSAKIKVSKQIIITGILQKIDFPTEELGTHQLVDEGGNIICSLRNPNSSIDLDDYVGLKVKIAGKSDDMVFDSSMIESRPLVLKVRNITVISK